MVSKWCDVRYLLFNDCEFYQAYEIAAEAWQRAARADEKQAGTKTLTNDSAAAPKSAPRQQYGGHGGYGAYDGYD